MNEYGDMTEQDYLDECGYMPGHGCLKAGSEYCDWECPFRDDYMLDLRIRNHPDNNSCRDFD